MSVERAGLSGTFNLFCDECDALAEPGFAGFREALSWARANSWVIEREKSGDWRHICPHCAVACGFAPAPYGTVAQATSNKK